MAVHDWTSVEAGIFHDFHLAWIAEVRRALNGGLLPRGYYALAEQHAGRSIPDVLTLHGGPPPANPLPLPPLSGGTAVAEAPPRVRRRQTVQPSAARLRRTVAVRHVSGHRLVALLEIVSPANKDHARSVADFAEKAASAIDAGIHVLLIDLFPPGPHDPHGLHGAVRQLLEQSDEPSGDDDPPAAEPLTLTAYAAGPPVDVYLEHVSVGAALPDMPLFLTPDWYVNVPLGPTYQATYGGVPAFWRDVIEGGTPPAA